MLTLPLVTERLLIDRLGPHDAPVVAGYRGDPSVARWQSWDAPYGIDRALALIAADAAEAAGAPGTGVNLAVRLHGALVGDVYLAVLAAVPQACEVGVTLAPAQQGRGLATEAVAAVLDAVFAAGVVTRAAAYVDTRNGPSLALFDRLGFQRDALLEGSFQDADGSSAEEVRFTTGADGWRRRRGMAHSVPSPAGPDPFSRRAGVDEELH